MPHGSGSHDLEQGGAVGDRGRERAGVIAGPGQIERPIQRNGIAGRLETGHAAKGRGNPD